MILMMIILNTLNENQSTILNSDFGACDKYRTELNIHLKLLQWRLSITNNKVTIFLF